MGRGVAPVLASVAEVEKMAEMYNSGRSLPQISKEFSIGISPVRRLLLRHGVVLRSQVEGIKMAKREGRGISPLNGKYKRTEAERAKLSQARIKWAESHAAGVTVNTNGYLAFTRGENIHRHVHVVIAEEQILGRRIQTGEVVHHIDGNKLNNDISNLRVMSRAAHTSLHRKEWRKDGKS